MNDVLIQTIKSINNSIADTNLSNRAKNKCVKKEVNRFRSEFKTFVNYGSFTSDNILNYTSMINTARTLSLSTLKDDECPITIECLKKENGSNDLPIISRIRSKTPSFTLTTYDDYYIEPGHKNIVLEISSGNAFDNESSVINSIRHQTELSLIDGKVDDDNNLSIPSYDKKVELFIISELYELLRETFIMYFEDIADEIERRYIYVKKFRNRRDI